MDLSGGNGNTGNGGGAGYLYIDCYGAEGINVGQSGMIDTRFIYPDNPPIKLGIVAMDVCSNLTVDCYATQGGAQAAVADGGYYLVFSDANLYLRDSVGSDQVVTGIHIRSGCTLTLGLNYNYGGNTGCDYAYVYVPDDIKIEGALKTKDLLNGGNPIGGALTPDVRHGEGSANDIDKGGLELSCNNLLITTLGSIDLSGTDATVANTRGGDGGWTWLYTYGAFIHGTINSTGGNGLGTGIGGDGAAYWGGTDEIYIWSDGLIVNTATLDASGGNGSTGGDAGYVYLDAYTNICNTGTLKSNGGTGTTGDGGDGNAFYFNSDYGSICNSGKIEGNGGNSTDGDGGNAFEVYMEAGDYGYIGQILNSGSIEASGGSSTNGAGGHGAYAYWETYGADIISIGSIDLSGGNAPAGTAGDGGDMDFYPYEGYDEGYGEYTPAGSVVLAGNINLSGGDGDTGGSGGYVYIDATHYDLEYHENPYGVYLYGYATISCAGGDGDSGGSASFIYILTYNYVETDDNYRAPGPISVAANLDLHGGIGNGATGTGGDGSYYYVETYENETYFNETSTFAHVGNVNVSGGNGGSSGGDAGWVYLYGWADVSFEGNVNGSGGDGTGTNASGGEGIDDFELYSSFNVRFVGALDASGGAATGTGTGGTGGEAYLYAGGQVYSRAAYNAGGGDANLSTGTGGNGGYIDLFSEMFPTSHSGAVDVCGGVGNTEGSEGTFRIDWTYYTP
jgi:hypothetical protein